MDGGETEKGKRASVERKEKKIQARKKGSIFIKDCWERNSQVGAKILIIEVKESNRRKSLVFVFNAIVKVTDLSLQPNY